MNQTTVIYRIDSKILVTLPIHDFNGQTFKMKWLACRKQYLWIYNSVPKLVQKEKNDFWPPTFA